MVKFYCSEKETPGGVVESQKILKKVLTFPGRRVIMNTTDKERGSPK
jgi:hypothetical protein